MYLAYILSTQTTPMETCPIQMLNEQEYNMFELVPRPVLKPPSRPKGSRQSAHGSPPTYIRLLLISLVCQTFCTSVGKIYCRCVLTKRLHYPKSFLPLTEILSFLAFSGTLNSFLAPLAHTITVSRFQSLLYDISISAVYPSQVFCLRPLNFAPFWLAFISRLIWGF